MEIRTEKLISVLGGNEILRGVEIDVHKKELIGLLGSNGSGKSTLLRCIYRMLKPVDGAVLDGRAIEEYSYKESARKISVLAQHNYYNFEFSVEDVVMMGRAPLTVIRKKIINGDEICQGYFHPNCGGYTVRAATRNPHFLYDTCR